MIKLMKTIAVYKSLTGFTKKYAEWISRELKADLVESKKANLKKLENYNLIIYGGSLHAVTISGLNKFLKKFRKLRRKKLIVYATGASPYKREITEKLQKKYFEKKENSEVFYLKAALISINFL